MRRLVLAAAALVALALAGCTAGGDPTNAGSPTPPHTPAPDHAPAAIVMTLDELRLVDAEDAVLETVAVRDGDVIGFFEDALGGPATVSTDEGYGFDFHDWTGVRVMPLTDGRGGWVTFTAAESSGLALRTQEGVAVGATREQAIAAGAVEGYVDDDSGYDILQLDTREEPGTESLERPGETGVVYVAIIVENGVVSQIGVPGNDFSDI